MLVLSTVTTVIQQSRMTKKFNFTWCIHNTFMHSVKRHHTVNVCRKYKLCLKQQSPGKHWRFAIRSKWKNWLHASSELPCRSTWKWQYIQLIQKFSKLFQNKISRKYFSHLASARVCFRLLINSWLFNPLCHGFVTQLVEFSMGWIGPAWELKKIV